MNLPRMKAYKEGRDVVMACEDVGSILREGYQTDRDEQSIMMTQIAEMIRQDIFAHKVTFSGSFDHNRQVESVPRSLLSLVMKYVLHLAQKDPWHCQCSMLTQVVVPCPSGPGGKEDCMKSVGGT